jgi:hypothetical protein
MMLPAPPADGGFLVLNDDQIGNLDLLCAIKTRYPHTKIYAQRPLVGVMHPEQYNDLRGLSREARRVMAIGNPSPGPSGMVGYFARQADLPLRAIRDAVTKLKAKSF